MPPAVEPRGGILEKWSRCSEVTTVTATPFCFAASMSSVSTVAQLSTRTSDFLALFTSLFTNARASQSWPS